MLTRAVTKQRYVAVCQYVMLLAVVAAVVFAGAGVAHIDLVGPPASTPTGSTVPGPASHP